MKEIQINNFEEKLYYEKLPNGFETFLVPLKRKKNFFTIVGVKYGGRDINFNIEGEKHTVPTGIAHFLEHKMFEKEDNPFSFYQKTGTDVNASTSYDFTRYYIIGNKQYKKNLTYLLKWLKDLNITKQQVEKEKGIILEEASMYKDNPDTVLLEKTNENIFINDPYNKKVIGTDEDIKSITKEEIELCYNTFYTPENMFLISVGNFNKNEAIEIIRKEVKEYKENTKKVEKNYGQEPNEVLKEEETLYMNIDIPRISQAYKIDKTKLKELNITSYELDVYLHMLIDISLGMTSDIRNKWLSENLFINSSYRVIETETHYVIEFVAVSLKPDELKKELNKYLTNVKIDKSSFERQKKLWIAGEVKNINNIQSIGYSLIDDILDYGQFINNKTDIIKKLDYDTLIKIKDIIKFDLGTTVKILPKK